MTHELRKERKTKFNKTKTIRKKTIKTNNNAEPIVINVNINIGDCNVSNDLPDKLKNIVLNIYNHSNINQYHKLHNSSEEEETSADEEESSTDEEESSADEEESSAEEEESSAEEDEFSDEEYIPPSDDEELLDEEDESSDDEEQLLDEEDLSESDNDFIIDEHDILSSEITMPPDTIKDKDINKMFMSNNYLYGNNGNNENDENIPEVNIEEYPKECLFVESLHHTYYPENKDKSKLMLLYEIIRNDTLLLRVFKDNIKTFQDVINIFNDYPLLYVYLFHKYSGIDLNNITEHYTTFYNNNYNLTEKALVESVKKYMDTNVKKLNDIYKKLDKQYKIKNLSNTTKDVIHKYNSLRQMLLRLNKAMITDKTNIEEYKKYEIYINYYIIHLVMTYPFLLFINKNKYEFNNSFITNLTYIISCYDNSDLYLFSNENCPSGIKNFINVNDKLILLFKDYIQ